ncbi:hypothetical protein N7517_009656 [Penicillium concentricum]|uniref:Uncharacterized protein n=1 Tax=Penicillium concentricum TaxID=293559 RepID=A0A9W9RJ28_9EURO|nr:uncharacterized protein N7517_009656 [Penicillium concentricum]KAJ5360465.1 hypothetical protein N7517_009656 [Penicillium concentricum]
MNSVKTHRSRSDQVLRSYRYKCDPRAPGLDLRYAVDGQREVTIHKPLSTASTGSKFQLQNKVIEIYAKGSAGSAFDTEQKIVGSVAGEV